jgi:hypothetical protein
MCGAISDCSQDEGDSGHSEPQMHIGKEGDPYLPTTVEFERLGWNRVEKVAAISR